MFLSDFVKLPQEERTKHIDLSTPCELKNFSKIWSRKTAFNKLLQLFNLQNDIEDRRKQNVQCCHHCEHDSTHGWCTNPLHISFGTGKENQQMIPETVRKERIKTAVRNNSTAESKAKTVANTDYAKRAEKYAQTRGTCYIVEHEDGRKFEVFGRRNAAKVIGCSEGAVKKALQRDGNFVYSKFKGWSIRRK